VVFSCYLKDAEESMERRLGLSEFQTDRTDTDKACDAKLELRRNMFKCTYACVQYQKHVYQS